MGSAKGLSICFLFALGCSSGAGSDSTRAAEPLTETEPREESPPVDEAPDHEQGLPRIQVVTLAEQFVREQGYVDTPPTRELVRKSLDAEDPQELSLARRGTLRPRHVGAYFDGGDWLVVFAYQSAGRSDFGRALRVSVDQTMQMVHQDIRLPEGVEAVTLVGRIVNMPPNNADCGTFHFVVTVEYEVLSVTSGEFDGSRVMVLQGCPELPRSQYQEGAGDAGPLALGDVHALQLVPYAPVTEGGHTFRGSAKHPELHRYWAQRTLRHALPE